jgi:hypothetical protein
VTTINLMNYYQMIQILHSQDNYNGTNMPL